MGAAAGTLCGGNMARMKSAVGWMGSWVEEDPADPADPAVWLPATDVFLGAAVIAVEPQVLLPGTLIMLRTWMDSFPSKDEAVTIDSRTA